MVGVFKFLIALFVVISVISVIAHIGKNDEKNTVSMSIAALGIVISGIFALMYLAD